MKILIYDNNEGLKEFCELMRMIPIEYSLDFATDFLEFKEYFNKQKYNIVFTELEREGQKNIEFIKETSPKQKLIILSAKTDCSEQLGCEFCKENYNQLRLIKPLDINDMVHSLKKHTQCDLLMCEDKFISDIVVLAKPFKSFELDKENLILKEKGENKNQIVKEKIYLSQKLSLSKIDYTVLEDQIKIYKPN